MQRLVGILPAVGIEQSQLLSAVDRIVGVVQIQQQLPRRSRERGDEGVAQRVGHTHQLGARHVIFQPRQRRLAGQVLAADGQTLTGRFQRRIGAQHVGVVGILVA